MAAPTVPSAATALPAVPDGFDELLSANVAIVTGKGGVGKTTVAASLALAGVASGRRTLLVEVEGRQSFSRTFATQPWDYEEREFRPGMWGVSIDPADSVYEYLELFYGLKRVQWLMEKSNAIDFVTTAAPGLRDLLLIGKIYEIEARKRDDGRRMYDLIVVDAPPTGRIVPFLQSPEGVTEIVRVGPIKRQAAQIGEMLGNARRTQAFLVTLLEEMPVQETVEGVAALQAAGIATGPVIANQVVMSRLAADEAAALERMGARGLTERAAAGGAELAPEVADLTLALAGAHRERLEMQADLQAAVVDRTGLPLLALPQLTGATFGADDLAVLADCLAVQVGERGPRAREATGFDPTAWAPAEGSSR